MVEIRPLDLEEINNAAFFELLRDAAGHDDEALRSILKNELPGLSIVGVTDDADVVAFAAFHQSPLRVTVDYIAVAAARRSTGLGRVLIASIRQRHPACSMVADTDDDAVDFYRRLGFANSPHQDAGWPERRRYRCVIGPLGEDSHVEGEWRCRLSKFRARRRRGVL